LKRSRVCLFKAMLHPYLDRPQSKYTNIPCVTKAIAADNAVAEAEAAALAEVMAADADGDGIITPDEEAQTIVSDEKLDLLDARMEHLITDLRALGWAFRGCYPGLEDESLQIHPEWKTFQLALLHEAMVFKDGLLLLTVTIFCHIGRFFKEYVEMDFKTWKKKLELMADNAEEVGECIRLLAALFRNFADDLRRRQGAAKDLLTALVTDAKNFRKGMDVLKMRWTVIEPFFCTLMFLPEVGSMAATFAVAGGDRAAAYSKEVQAKTSFQKAAAAGRTLSDSLIPIAARIAQRLQDIRPIFEDMAEPVRKLKMSDAEIEAMEQIGPASAKGAGGKGAAGSKASLPGAPKSKQPQGDGEVEPTQVDDATEELTPEEFLEETRRFHYQNIRLKADRIFNWCSDLNALDPLFDYDLSFVPAEWLENKEYVENWIDEAKDEEGEMVADTFRDVTENAEILLALPR